MAGSGDPKTLGREIPGTPPAAQRPTPSVAAPGPPAPGPAGTMANLGGFIVEPWRQTGNVVGKVWDFYVDEYAQLTKILVNCGAAAWQAPDFAKMIAKGDFDALFDALAQNKKNLDCMCACLHGGEPFSPTLGDRFIIGFSRWYVRKQGPLALKHLDWYLAGSGKDFVEALDEIIERDTGFRQAIIDDIVQAGSRQPAGAPRYENLRGDAQVSQLDYQVQDYRYALGNVDHVFWEVQTTPAARARNAAMPGFALVHCRLKDKYEWHPIEERPTQCLHLALENAKLRGAKDFWEVGDADVMLNLPPDLIPTPLPTKPP